MMSNSEKTLNRIIVFYSLPVLVFLSIMCLIVGEPIIDFSEIWREPFIEKGVGCIILSASTFLWACLIFLTYLAV